MPTANLTKEEWAVIQKMRNPKLDEIRDKEREIENLDDDHTPNRMGIIKDDVYHSDDFYAAFTGGDEYLTAPEAAKLFAAVMKAPLAKKGDRVKGLDRGDYDNYWLINDCDVWDEGLADVVEGEIPQEYQDQQEVIAKLKKELEELKK